MKKTILTISAVALATIFGISTISKKHIGPDYLYPNPQYTTGLADTLNVADITKSYDGKTYSQSHRNVPESEKKSVMKEYGNPTGKIEIDHFFPICAGASNDIKNLWPQPEHNLWKGQDFGFHTKDRLETWICNQIKEGKLDPKVAYQKITSDWVAYYIETFLNSKTSSVYNEDDVDVIDVDSK